MSTNSIPTYLLMYPPSTAECPLPALQEAAGLSHERTEGEEGGLL